MNILNKKNLKELYLKYSKIHDKLNFLEKEVQSLLNEHKELSNELSTLRDEEKILINKIEEDINRTLLPEEIISIINE
jgi:septation ring formation regulator EzrA